jgi:hypothetical protein
VKVSEPDMNLELAIRVRTTGEVSPELRGKVEAVARLATGELGGK